MSAKTKLLLASATLTATIIWLLIYLRYLPSGNLTLVFCDVGQGDGIYVNLPNGDDVVIDGGPDNKILNCLGKNMPPWDRTIEMVFLTHPQADHMNGLIPIIKRYNVNHFITTPIANSGSKGYKDLLSLIKQKKIKIKNVYSGDRIKFTNYAAYPHLPVQFRVLWPSRSYIISKSKEGQALLSNGAGSILGAHSKHKDLNDFSLVLELKYGQFEALLTADADKDIQETIIKTSKVNPVEIFKIPHHGSKNGIHNQYLNKASPDKAIVSVGNNNWGHPAKEIISNLKKQNINLYRTDYRGDITIITDGKQYSISTAK